MTVTVTSPSVTSVKSHYELIECTYINMRAISNRIHFPHLPGTMRFYSLQKRIVLPFANAGLKNNSEMNNESPGNKLKVVTKDT